jgi:four helix bundle protein
VSNFRNLLVWEKAHRLSLDVHATASAIRGSNHTTLKSQLIRAAESVAQTIVEGCGEQTPSEFARYLRSSLNSANEVEYHLLVGRDRDVIRPKDFENLTGRTIEVRRMLYGLLRKVEGKDKDKDKNKGNGKDS